jgi:hypothetical protein
MFAENLKLTVDGYFLPLLKRAEVASLPTEEADNWKLFFSERK